MQVWLYIRDANYGERTIKVPPTGATIGRSIDNVVRSEDARVSRHHAAITQENGSWYVTDQGSAGGTFVNDQHITRVLLNHGDVVQCGGLVMRFVIVTATASPAQAAEPARPEAGVQPPAQSGASEALFRSQSPGYLWKDGCEPGPENIERLLVCIPIFEDPSRTFYDVDPQGQGLRFGPEVYRLTQVAIEQGLVCESNAVDWLSTKAAIYRNPAAIDTADLYTCQRLLTAFVDDDPQLAIKLSEALDGGLLLRVLWRLRAIRDEMLLGNRRTREEGRIQLLLGDLTNMGVDAIVASSDEHLGGGGRLERYLRERGGPDFVAACQRMGSCPVGEARAINGYRLPAGVVLFTVGPQWRGGAHAEDAALVRCYDSCLELAANTDLHTVAFPAISTGFEGFPPERAARLAVASVRRYFARNPGSSVWKVYFVCYDDAMFGHYEAALRLPPEPLPALAVSPATASVDARPAADPQRDAAAVEPPAHARPPAPAITLPNPEARPVGTFLTHELLINCLFSQVTLEAFRFSRTLLNEPTSQLSDLEQLVDEWLGAHDSGPAAELAQLRRWSEGNVPGPKLLEDLCDRMAVLAHGALGWQQPSCLYGFRVFLRALRDAYVLQAKLFGLDAKLAKGKPTSATPHKPRPRELPDAWAFVYLGSIVSHRSARVMQSELMSFAASAEVRPLSAGDPALHLRIARNLSIGTSTLAGSGEDFFLITGYLASLDRYYQLRVHTGTTEMVPRERWSAGSLPLDYVLIDDSHANQDVARFDLSPADPEGSAP